MRTLFAGFVTCVALCTSVVATADDSAVRQPSERQYLAILKKITDLSTQTFALAKQFKALKDSESYSQSLDLRTKLVVAGSEVVYLKDLGKMFAIISGARSLPDQEKKKGAQILGTNLSSFLERMKLEIEFADFMLATTKNPALSRITQDYRDCLVELQSMLAR
jgi:hypothetical protein